MIARRSLVAVVLALALGAACQQRDDGMTPRDCGETSAHCDGQDG